MFSVIWSGCIRVFDGDDDAPFVAINVYLYLKIKEK